ncbi:MAG: hypothetical protein QME47_00660 [Candidatus Thermoplasmatota archaeon]|nr:hypothetical protein [Candidatus Thermoplasmatota archaeon]
MKKIINVGNEHLIMIECSEDKKIWAKILHLKAVVKENERVEVGDRLGTLE